MYVWHIHVVPQLEVDGARVHINVVESFAIFAHILKEMEVKLYELALLPLHLYLDSALPLKSESLWRSGTTGTFLPILSACHDPSSFHPRVHLTKRIP